ncbi:MAG: substrate-binding domain-containing protein [Propionibacterium sp.]|nr:substrate-binding domain-containing protein [Propionibacterium sp.]
MSSQTVSRVSNGSDSVRPATRDMVLAVMDRLGYRPNFAARALKRGRFKAIGVAMFDIVATGNLLTLEGITKAASDLDYAVTITMMGKGQQRSLAAVVERMKNLPVDGVIVILEQMLPDVGTVVPPAGMEVLLVTSAQSTTMSTIDEDQYGCSTMVTNYFLDRGHRTVHFVSGPEESLDSHFREQGWIDALARRGVVAPPVIRGDWSADSGFNAGLELAHVKDCTAIYAANDNEAYGVMQGLAAAGKRVPDDVSVIGVDDVLRNLIPRLTLTSVKMNFGAVGRRAFRMVARAIEDPQRSRPTRELIPGVLVERSSVRDLTRCHVAGRDMARHPWG